ncbi:MAG: hypothetical protein K2J55_05900, partial [Eubacterium sp.]|nr:hypothetical protein [Eubacterium sp.]
LIIGAINLGGFIITTFTIIPPSYFLQQIIPSMITIIERILISQAVGRQIAITQPAPNAIHKKSLRHIRFIIVNTSLCCIYYIL